MKRQIRSSVFETNSSSMHSLVIMKDNVNNEQNSTSSLWLNNGVLKIYDENELDFGRFPFRCLTSFKEKLCYAIASLCGYRSNREEIFEDIKNLVSEIIPKCKDIELPTHSWSWEDEEEIVYGNVDEDILTDFLKENNIELKDFLTNSKYIVIVDGDEYCTYSAMKSSGIINIGNIEKEYPDYSNY